MTTTTTTLNGIDVAVLQQTVETVEAHPEAASVVFRGRTVWDQGPAGDSFAEEMEQAGSVTSRNFRSRG